MKRFFYAAVVAALLSGCNQQPALKVTVSNEAPFDRTSETVEVAWSALTARNGELTPENVVVLAGDVQVPSQVLYYGGEEPCSVIFQADVAANSTAAYRIVAGTREEYAAKAFGRYVPERLDDYAWENNLVAYRLYGPSLTDPISPGMDVWVKCTDELIINKWFAENDYHHNKGEGMDCYKVGTTLGGGACVPVSGDKLVLGGNYATQQRLDNGPLRTSVRLTYDDFDVDGRKVSLTKIIELDAGTYFNRITDIYTDSSDTLAIATGMVLHKVRQTLTGRNFAAITEAASDSKQPDIDGDISLAVIVPAGLGTLTVSQIESYGRKRAPRAEHLVVRSLLQGPDKVLEYWSGSAWSGAGMTPDRWEQEVRNKLLAIRRPLKVRYR